MIKIHVKFFAVVREQAGTSEFALHLSDSSTVAEARDAIADRFPQIRTLVNRSAYALNRVYAAPDTRIVSGDELAVIPPVSGG